MYEELTQGMEAETETWYEKVRQIVETHIHARNCQLYHNMQFMCDSVVKMTKASKIKGRKTDITIHDILTFECNNCGHGLRNKRINERGELEKIYQHGAYGCQRECCDQFLDRRYLQYNGGNCECGVLIMKMLGIIPATEEQHKWRWAFFRGRFQQDEGVRVKTKLAPFFTSMRIRKPQLIIWYVMAQGQEFWEKWQHLTRVEKEATLWGIRKQLSDEYGTHQPIQ